MFTGIVTARGEGFPEAALQEAFGDAELLKKVALVARSRV